MRTNNSQHCSQEIKMPKTKQEGLANFVQMIINQLERGETNEALLTAVDLWNDVAVTDGPYRLVEESAGKKMAALQSELQQKHITELAKTDADAFERGKAAARREMAERLGLVAA